MTLKSNIFLNQSQLPFPASSPPRTMGWMCAPPHPPPPPDREGGVPGPGGHGRGPHGARAGRVPPGGDGQLPRPPPPLPDLRGGGVGLGTGGRLVWFVGLVGAVLERSQIFGVCAILGASKMKMWLCCCDVIMPSWPNSIVLRIIFAGAHGFRWGCASHNVVKAEDMLGFARRRRTPAVVRGSCAYSSCPPPPNNGLRLSWVRGSALVSVFTVSRWFPSQRQTFPQTANEA